MKIIVVILVLIQISLIVPNPNNIESEQKESKGICRNLNHQRRLGAFDFLKNIGKKIINTGETIVNGVKKVGGKIVEVSKKVANTVKTGFVNVMETGIGFFRVLIKDLGEAKDTFPELIKDIVDSIKENFI